MCPICGLEEESAAHSLWNCLVAQDVWSQASIKLQKLSFINYQFDEILLMEKLNKLELSEAAFIFKYIWFRRNAYVYHKGFNHPNLILHQAKDDFSAYITVNSRLLYSSNSTQAVQATTRWLKPPIDMVKVNWDAAFTHTEQIAGVGVIIQNHEGLVLGTVHSRRQLNSDAYVIECYAFFFAVQFYIDAGFSNLIFKSDAQKVVKEVLADELNWSTGAFLIQNAKFLLCSLGHQSIQHAHKEANVVAHVLAWEAIVSNVESFDLENVSDCIKDIVTTEAQ